MSNPKISIIVPIYNGEKFVQRCLNNITSQTFRDFEAILVDDGSTDRSGAVCEEYAKKDNRFRVLHQKNAGVSSARNLGIVNAKGDWIAFVDCDDSIKETYLEHLYPQELPQSCLVMAPYSNVGQQQRHLLAGLYQGKDMVLHVINNKLLNLSGPYAKLYNRNVITENGILFPKGVHMGEDGIFVTEYLNAVDSLLVVDKNDYWVNTIEGSLSSRYNEFSSELKGFVIWRNEISRFVNRYDDLFDCPLKVVWNSPAVVLFIRCLQCSFMLPHLSFSERIKLLQSIPSKDMHDYVNYKTFVGKRDKLHRFLLSHSFFFTYVITESLLKRLHK